MNNKLELQKVKNNIKELQEEQKSYEKELQQLENRQKEIEKKEKIKKKNLRTKRLVERGAILEKYLEIYGEEYSNKEIENIIFRMINTNECRRIVAEIKANKNLKSEGN